MLPNPHPAHLVDPSELLLTITHPATGRVIAQLTLRPGGFAVPSLSVNAPPVSSAGKDAQPDSSIAGSIEPPVGSLPRVIKSWLDHMTARKKTAKTIAAYRQVVDRARTARGWSEVEHLTFEQVTGYLAEQAWSGSTYNRNLTCFRSLTRYATAAGFLMRDPLLLADRAEDDSDGGSRAARTEEARTFIRDLWARGLVDARCTGNPALYAMCLFKAGCRFSEPSLWCRRHLVLDTEPAIVIWTKDINKNGKHQETPLDAELAELLRRHLAAVDVELKTLGRAPAGPDDRVFPIVPNRKTFRESRARAGIADLDARGRSWTPHSARKWFATELSSAGVVDRVVDVLMRHSTGVPGRYFDPRAVEYVAAVGLLPRLWPEPALPGPRGVEGRANVDNPSRLAVRVGRDLTSRGEISDSGGASLGTPRSSSSASSDQTPQVRGRKAGHDPPEQSESAFRDHPQQVESTRFSSPPLGISGTAGHDARQFQGPGGLSAPR